MRIRPFNSILLLAVIAIINLAIAPLSQAITLVNRMNMNPIPMWAP